jgi:hypothetical protein
MDPGRLPVFYGSGKSPFLELWLFSEQDAQTAMTPIIHIIGTRAASSTF